MVKFNQCLVDKGWELLRDAHDLGELLQDAEQTKDQIRKFNYSREWAIDADTLDMKLTKKYKEISELKLNVFTLNQVSNAIHGNDGGDGFNDFQRLEKLLELDQLGILFHALKAKGNVKDIGEFIIEVV